MKFKFYKHRTKQNTYVALRVTGEYQPKRVNDNKGLIYCIISQDGESTPSVIMENFVNDNFFRISKKEACSAAPDLVPHVDNKSLAFYTLDDKLYTIIDVCKGKPLFTNSFIKAHLLSVEREQDALLTKDAMARAVKISPANALVLYPMHKDAIAAQLIRYAVYSGYRC